MMGRCFDHHFVGPNAIHLIIDPIPFSAQLSFDPQGRKLIRNDSQCPSGSIGRCSIVSEGNDLGRRLILISFTKRTEPADRFSFFCREIRGSSSPFCGDDHPPSMDGISSEFWHDKISFETGKEFRKENYLWPVSLSTFLTVLSFHPLFCNRCIESSLVSP